MNLRQALRLKKDFGFQKKTVTMTESGHDKVFHYFETTINGLPLMLSNDDDDISWYGTIFDYPVKFYTPASFRGLILSVMEGHWNE
jgi:virulence-associated protein VagC